MVSRQPVRMGKDRLTSDYQQVSIAWQIRQLIADCDSPHLHVPKRSSMELQVEVTQEQQ